MAQILIVHGIGNQFEGEMELRGPWHRALCDGLLRVGHQALPQEADCFCPFYGDLFRPAGHLGVGPAIDESDVEEASPTDAALIEAVWQAAIMDDPTIPGPDAFADSLAYAPRMVERALTSLAKARYLADYTPLQLFGDLKHVVAYLNDPAIRSSVLERVLARIEPDTRIVIGHSLGSVVAYEAVCAKPANISTLLTLGSPLGIKNVVFDKLTPAPTDGRGHWGATGLFASGISAAERSSRRPIRTA